MQVKEKLRSIFKNKLFMMMLMTMAICALFGISTSAAACQHDWYTNNTYTRSVGASHDYCSYDQIVHEDRCRKCGETREMVDNVTNQVSHTPESYTESGDVNYCYFNCSKCTNCGYILSHDGVSHNYVEDGGREGPTQDYCWIQRYTCSSCGKTKSDYESHTAPSDFEYPTCGSYSFECVNCGTTVSGYYSHDYEKVDGTQNSSRCYQEKCRNCGDTENVYHSFSYTNWVKNTDVQHKRTKTCSKCGYSATETENHTKKYTAIAGNYEQHAWECTKCSMNGTENHGGRDSNGKCPECNMLLKSIKITSAKLVNYRADNPMGIWGNDNNTWYIELTVEQQGCNISSMALAGSSDIKTRTGWMSTEQPQISKVVDGTVKSAKMTIRIYPGMMSLPKLLTDSRGFVDSINGLNKSLYVWVKDADSDTTANSIVTIDSSSCDSGAGSGTKINFDLVGPEFKVDYIGTLGLTYDSSDGAIDATSTHAKLYQQYKNLTWVKYKNDVNGKFTADCDGLYDTEDIIKTKGIVVLKGLKVSDDNLGKTVSSNNQNIGISVNGEEVDFSSAGDSGSYGEMIVKWLAEYSNQSMIDFLKTNEAKKYVKGGSLSSDAVTAIKQIKDAAALAENDIILYMPASGRLEIMFTDSSGNNSILRLTQVQVENQDIKITDESGTELDKAGSDVYEIEPKYLDTLGYNIIHEKPNENVFVRIGHNADGYVTNGSKTNAYKYTYNRNNAKEDLYVTKSSSSTDVDVVYSWTMDSYDANWTGVAKTFNVDLKTVDTEIASDNKFNVSIPYYENPAQSNFAFNGNSREAMTFFLCDEIGNVSSVAKIPGLVHHNNVGDASLNIEFKGNGIEDAITTDKEVRFNGRNVRIRYLNKVAFDNRSDVSVISTIRLDGTYLNMYNGFLGNGGKIKYISANADRVPTIGIPSESHEYKMTDSELLINNASAIQQYLVNTVLWNGQTYQIGKSLLVNDTTGANPIYTSNFAQTRYKFTDDEFNQYYNTDAVQKILETYDANTIKNKTDEVIVLDKVVPKLTSLKMKEVAQVGSSSYRTDTRVGIQFSAKDVIDTESSYYSGIAKIEVRYANTRSNEDWDNDTVWSDWVDIKTLDSYNYSSNRVSGGKVNINYKLNGEKVTNRVAGTYEDFKGLESTGTIGFVIDPGQRGGWFNVQIRVTDNAGNVNDFAADRDALKRDSSNIISIQRDGNPPVVSIQFAVNDKTGTKIVESGDGIWNTWIDSNTNPVILSNGGYSYYSDNVKALARSGVIIKIKENESEIDTDSIRICIKDTNEMPTDSEWERVSNRNVSGFDTSYTSGMYTQGAYTDVTKAQDTWIPIAANSDKAVKNMLKGIKSKDEIKPGVNYIFVKVKDVAGNECIYSPSVEAERNGDADTTGAKYRILKSGYRHMFSLDDVATWSRIPMLNKQYQNDIQYLTGENTDGSSGEMDASWRTSRGLLTSNIGNMIDKYSSDYTAKFVRAIKDGRILTTSVYEVKRTDPIHRRGDKTGAKKSFAKIVASGSSGFKLLYKEQIGTQLSATYNVDELSVNSDATGAVDRTFDDSRLGTVDFGVEFYKLDYSGGTGKYSEASSPTYEDRVTATVKTKMYKEDFAYGILHDFDVFTTDNSIAQAVYNEYEIPLSVVDGGTKIPDGVYAVRLKRYFSYTKGNGSNHIPVVTEVDGVDGKDANAFIMEFVLFVKNDRPITPVLTKESNGIVKGTFKYEDWLTDSTLRSAYKKTIEVFDKDNNKIYSQNVSTDVVTYKPTQKCRIVLTMTDYNGNVAKTQAVVNIVKDGSGSGGTGGGGTTGDEYELNGTLVETNKTYNVIMGNRDKSNKEDVTIAGNPFKFIK